MSNAYEELYNKIKTLNKQWFYDKTEITSLINGKANVNHAHTDKEDAIEFITGTTTNTTNVLGGTSTKLNSLQNGTKILYKTPAQSSTDSNTVYLELTLANGTTSRNYLCDATGGFLATKEIPANAVLSLVFVTSFQSRWHIVSRSNDATTSSSGLMSKTDKTKLDGLSNFSGSYNDLTNKPTIPDVNGKEDKSNKVISFDEFSTDTEYPSAKAVYDEIWTNLYGTIQSEYVPNDSLGNLAYVNDLDLSGHDLDELSDNTNLLFSGDYDDLTNKPTIPTATSDLTNDSNFISTSNTSGLIKNDGTVDTTSYSTQNVWYGTCDSSASAQVKEVDVSNWSFNTGNILFVKFSYGNSYDGNAELKIGNVSTRIRIRTASDESVRYHWVVNETVCFTYDGTSFVMVNGGMASTTYYGVTKLEDSVSSVSTTTSATPNSVKQAYDLANRKANTSHTHGAVTNDGKVTTNVDVASGDYIIISDVSDSNKIKRTLSVLTSHIKDSTAYANIGSSANDTQATINSKINTALGTIEDDITNILNDQSSIGDTLNDLYVDKADTNHTHTASNITISNDLDNVGTGANSSQEAVNGDIDWCIGDLYSRTTPVTVNNLDSGFTTSTMQTTNILHPANSNDLMQYHFNQSVNEDIGDLWNAMQNKELEVNKVTSLSSASTNTQYPSAKAVYDSLDAKADKSAVVDWDNIVFVDKADDATGSIILNFLS